MGEVSWQKIASLLWEKKKKQDDFCVMAEIVHHSVAYVILSAMPIPVPLMLKGLGNVSVELVGRMVEFWVTVSLWKSHVLHALDVNKYPIAWLKVNKAYGKL